MTAAKTVKHATRYRTNWKFGNMLYADLFTKKVHIQFVPQEFNALYVPIEVQFRDSDYDCSMVVYAEIKLILHIQDGKCNAFADTSEGIKYVTLSGKPLSEKGKVKLQNMFKFIGQDGANLVVYAMVRQIIETYDSEFQRLAKNIQNYLNMPKKERQFIGWL